MEDLFVYARKARRPWGWYVLVENYHMQTCLHLHKLTGLQYSQDCRSSDRETKEFKASQTKFLQDKLKVVITIDDPTKTPWERLGYYGFFHISNPRFINYVLTFTLGRQIARLYRPSDGKPHRT